MPSDRTRLARELAAVVAEIREQENFGSFAKPPSAEELIQEAVHGPVVVFNISRYRSDALLLTPQGTITSLPLPALTVDSVTRQTSALQRALQAAALGQDSPAQQLFSQILAWLWDSAAGPVLDTLGYRSRPAPDARWPRIWWVPGGLMSQLPIHAAGHHDDPFTQPGRRVVLDRVISSYVPTIGALRHARLSAPPPAEALTGTPALIVAMPTTPELPAGNLPMVVEGTRMLASRLPGAAILIEPNSDDQVSTPAPDMPTRDNVFTRLPGCPVVHFACHGIYNPADPSNSRLLLHDHRSNPLTVAALGSIHLPPNGLAYLSACNTAVSASTPLIDEAIHLAPAFQLAGYPHVIGTLWAINDKVAASIADIFYASLARNDQTLDLSQAATAIHAAVSEIRRIHADPSLWAAYVHVGALPHANSCGQSLCDHVKPMPRADNRPASKHTGRTAANPISNRVPRSGADVDERYPPAWPGPVDVAKMPDR